jgi:AraC-like DNA-binding protein
MTISIDSWPEELMGKNYSGVFNPHQPPFPFMVWWGCETHKFSHFVESNMTPNSFLFVYVISGEIKLSINNTIKKVSTGYAFIATSEQLLSYTKSGNQPLEIISFLIMSSNLTGFAEKISHMCDYVINLDKTHPALQNLVKLANYSIDIVDKNDKPEKELFVIYLTGFLMELHREAKHHEQISNESPAYGGIYYMLLNFSKKITLSDISDMVMISPNHFSILFHNEFGYTPIQFLSRMRLFFALYTLKITKQSMQKIAKICGLNDTINFCRICKKYLSLTPNESSKLTNHELMDKIWPGEIPIDVQENIFLFAKQSIDKLK